MAKTNRFRIPNAVTGILTVLLLQAGMSLPAFAAEIHHFDIDTTDAATAIHQFGSQSGVQILASAEVLDGKLLNKISGELSTHDGFQKLLAGTGLSPRYVGERAVALVTEMPMAGTDSSNISSMPQVDEPGIRMGDGRQRPLTSPRLAQADTAMKAEAASQSDELRASASFPGNSEKRTTLEAVIVTATKREQRVQDVPMSIAVISNQEIERRGLIGMEDYLRSIPGVSQIDRGGQDNAIVIRGITTSPQSENIAAGGGTVASYFDETPITGAAGLSGGGIDVRPVDLERIEVLRGPQGTAFGSNSLGGTLRIIPVKPKLNGFGAKVAASYSDTSGFGSDNSMIQGVLNVPVVQDKFALRAVGYRYDESGFYRNIAGIDPVMIANFENFGLGDYVRGFVQDDVGRMVSTGGRLAALWVPTGQLDLSLNVLTQTIEQDGKPTAQIGPFEQSRAPVAPQIRVRGEPGEVSDSDLDLLNLVLNYDLDWATLTSAVSWVDSSSKNADDITAGLGGLPSSTSYPSKFESFTVEARLASQLEGRFQYLAGLFYEDVDNFFLQTLDWPGTPETSPFGDPIGFYFEQTNDRQQRAIFGEVSYDLTERLTATAGGRYFKYDKDERNITTFVTPTGQEVPTRLQSSESDSNFKGNLSYEPTEGSLLYASWTQGFRLGGPTVGLPPTCDADNDGIVDGSDVSIASTRSIDSDLLDSYEIGGKFSLFDRRMTLDTAVYRIEWEGLPISATAGTCLVGYTANAGAATSEGVEFQASLLLAEGLRLEFGAGYTEAELAKPGLGAPAGSRLPGSPKVNANLAAQYDFNVVGHKAFVRVDSVYAGKFYGDLFQTEGLAAGDYIKVDARAGVTIKRLSVELFVRNATNEDAYTWRSTFIQEPLYGYRLRPRTIGIQLGYSFE